MKSLSLVVAFLVAFCFITLYQTSIDASILEDTEPYLPGHVFAGVGEGKIQHYDGSGNLLGTLDTGLGNYFTTGCSFDSVGNFYVTTFNAGGVTKFRGPDTPHTNLGMFGSGYSGSPESIVFDAVGNVYVGAVDGDGDIRTFDAEGNPVAQFDVELEDRGADWIDLAADQRTMFYTSEGKRILRYDVVSDSQLSDFASSLPGSRAYAFRILPDEGIIVADTESVLRLDATGKIVKTYDVPQEDSWFSLNLDPDGKSFWAGNFSTGKFYKFDIEAGGDPLLTVNTGVGADRLFGICVYSEITIAIQDTDGDGLLDDWEENGYDFDEDGTPDVDLPEMGAKKDRKDIFVHVDWIEKSGFLGHSHHPGSALDKIVEAFADAPVDNPDKSTGVTLHIIFGHKIEETDSNRELGSAIGGCDYSWAEFAILKENNFPTERWPIFHYAIFAHDMPSFNCGSYVGRPSGISRNANDFETGASDFLVSLGGWEILYGLELANVRAGTFMHELGHNLGLGHGGLDIDDSGGVIGANHTNYKPNHLSVMNYSFQSRGLSQKTFLGLYTEGHMDYSRFGSDVMPDLTEGELNESEGMNVGDAAKDYGTRYYCQGTNATRTLNGLQQAIDWNCDGDETDTEVSTSINRDTDLETLTSANEWAHLVFDGGAVGALGALPELPETTSMEISPEITFEEDLQIGPYSPAVPIYVPVVASP